MDPERAPSSTRAIRSVFGRRPILGVCFGHQALAAAFGARIARSPQPRHGQTSAIEHPGSGLFHGIQTPMIVARYHSLHVVESTLPPFLRVTARADDGQVMAIEGSEFGAYGIQFHPESFMTPRGPDLLANFYSLAREWHACATSPTG
jgi:anthranilate synthase/aminodeoxychorismate synthase-like glutamine amidotransferase